MTTDVLIVGGGIGGAALALALGRRGWSVRVFEREEAPPSVVRPEILQQSTIDALERLGADARLHAEAALPLHRLQLHMGRECILSVDERDLAAADSQPLSTDPVLTRTLIIDAALATGNVELVTNAEVTTVVRDGERIVGVRGRREGHAFEARARLLVGDDGARSIIRGCLGIRTRLRLFPVEFITFSVPCPAPYPAHTARGWIRSEAMRDGLFAGFVLPLPDDRLAGLLLASIGVWERRFEGRPDAFWRDVEALTPLAGPLRDDLHFPDDFERRRRAYGHASRYVDDGAAILGDAAHPMSPAAGQSANASIWDALALADVADEALRADDLSASRLAAFERRRRPANRRSLRFSRRAVALLRLDRWFPGSAAATIRTLLRRSGQKRRLLHMAATAFRE